ncbi:MAG TPA: heavy metal-binding domain-containing protein [Kouleothrix sp.]|nr:heavy metal-binding domain-containing protein [Kouleothrix sp.]HRC77908.1 heavy metal-binding domain-containing protein [Kouleothrix sp.]
MHCSMCDAVIPPDSQFCIICGAPVAAAQTGATQRLRPDQPLALDPAMVTSAFTLPGYRLVRSLGIVRGLTVRSASFGGQIAAAFQSLAGGNIRTMTTVCEHARTEAYRMIVEHAAQLGANAIVGFGYDTTEIAQGMTEVLAYGTAVMVEPEATGRL